MKQYQKMKDSQMKWVENIPKHWEVKRLKFTTKFELSTVDRHEYDDEIQVSICHYPQVYNNEKITKNIELSRGTCNQKELEKFRLKKDDVLITKDSETANDIGVPVYIQDDFENTVCGYHIAQLTTDKNQILGSFLFRFIQSNIVNAYFETESNGVTRFGLGKDSIDNLKVIIPSITEQDKITKILDKTLEKINFKILTNLDLIKHLQEKKQSTINLVTKGLEPLIATKDSGIEWVGRIPDHWKVGKMKFFVNLFMGYAFESEKFHYGDGGILLIRGDNVTEGKIRWGEKTRKWLEITPDLEDFSLKINDILIGMDGSKVGKNFAIVTQRDIPSLLVQRVARIRVKNKLLQKYLYYQIANKSFSKYIDSVKTNIAIPHMSPDNIKEYHITIPPLSEQKIIVKEIDKKIFNIEKLICSIRYNIESLKELHQSLILSTTTGKIDVREVVA